MFNIGYETGLLILKLIYKNLEFQKLNPSFILLIS